MMYQARCQNGSGSCAPASNQTYNDVVIDETVLDDGTALIRHQESQDYYFCILETKTLH